MNKFGLVWFGLAVWPQGKVALRSMLRLGRTFRLGPSALSPSGGPMTGLDWTGPVRPARRQRLHAGDDSKVILVP